MRQQNIQVDKNCSQVVQPTEKIKRDFLRYEFKYILDQRTRDAVEAEVRHFVDLDGHAKNLPDNKYFVRSLYFDDAQYSSFYEKVEGIKNRSKFRLRTYSRTPDFDALFVLEQKGRRNLRVFKQRAPVALDAQKLIGTEHNITSSILSACEQGRLRDRFVFDVFRKGIRPVALVDYMRRPYFSKINSDFRVTFDDSIMGTKTDSMFPIAENSVPILPGYTVLEVKFDRCIPVWMLKIIRNYELKRVSISKICTAMQCLGIAQDG